jgi:hypothetical protein
MANNSDTGFHLQRHWAELQQIFDCFFHTFPIHIDLLFNDADTSPEPWHYTQSTPLRK